MEALFQQKRFRNKGSEGRIAKTFGDGSEKTISKVELAQQEAYANFAKELAEKIGVNARLNYSVHGTYTKSPKIAE